MAQTNYSKQHGRAERPSGVVSRQEYQLSSMANAPRGQELPQAKLLDLDVGSVRSAAKQRESLRKHIKENLSNDALARIHGVSVRTIERVLSYETWSHIA